MCPHGIRHGHAKDWKLQLKVPSFLCSECPCALSRVLGAQSCREERVKVQRN